MKYIFALFFILFSFNAFAQSIFNPVIIDEYKALNIQSAVEYLQRKLNPKFPKDTQIKIDDVTLSGEHFKFISFYYTEYDGATRGTSQYFISFWKDNKEYLTCLGSNLLNIYDPLVTISNNIITIKAYKLYEPLSVYYYSFIYERSKILFHSIMEISTDGNNNTEIKYHYSSSDAPVNINSISADKLIKK